MKISRRKLLKQIIASSSSSIAASSIGGLPFLLSACGGGTASSPTPPTTNTTNNPAPPSNNTRELLIPLLDKGTLGSDGIRHFTLTAQTGTSELITNVQTATAGFNGSFLGPTLRMRQGEKVSITINNELNDLTTVHWHGLKVPASMDGGPHQTIASGASKEVSFDIQNPAATLWYHPHPHGKTGEQVYSGLAGLIVIDDDNSDALSLPNDYGVDDIPLIIQDRRINSDGSLAYITSNRDQMGMKGDHILVNGRETPQFNAPAQWVRFRIHNGSNARLYNLGFSDDRTFYRIGNDGGYLETSIESNRLLIAPAERVEILVDLSSDAANSLTLLSYSSEVPGSTMGSGNFVDDLDNSNFDIMSINVNKSATRNITPSNTLNSITALVANSGIRRFTLEHQMQSFYINGLAFDMNRIDAEIKVGSVEIWEIVNNNGMPHPFHVHAEFFQILSRDGTPVSLAESGWKDTVLIKPFETVQIVIGFSDHPDPDHAYMFHCHILEHEDRGMMGQFVKTT